MNDLLVCSDALCISILTIMGDKLAVPRTTENKRKNSAIVNKIMMSEYISEEFREAMKEKAGRAAKFIRSEILEMKREQRPIRLDPPNSLRGNYQSWVLADMVISKSKRVHKGFLAYKREFVEKMDFAITSAINRSSSSITSAEGLVLKEYINEVSREISSVIAIKEHLRQLYREALSKYQRIFDMTKLGMTEEEYIEYEEDKLGRARNPIKRLCEDESLFIVESLGDLVYIFDKERKTRIISTHLHFFRALNMVDTLVNITLCSADLKFDIEPSSIPSEIMSICRDIYLVDADIVGEVLKGCRNIAIAHINPDHITSPTPVRDLLRLMEDNKRFLVEQAIDRLRALVKTPEDAINICNLYKFVPHADSNMHDVFESIMGVRNPNSVTVEMEMRFRASAMKAIYKSLSSQGYLVKLVNIGEHGHRLQRLSEATVVRKNKMYDLGYTDWADVQFRKLEQLGDPNEIKVPISSKASQVNASPITFDLDDLLDNDGMYIDEVNEFIIKNRTVNDAVSAIKGECSISKPGCIKRFEEVIVKHEEFEKLHGPGDPEQISIQKMSKFLSENPDATYLVGTEPKFGEYHKKVTRMFYMAEQDLKDITQRVERYAKQISRMQSGVSIVKSYTARREDLETFCRSMLYKDDSLQSIFISFDMSEFSKKFPMQLLRAYGLIMANLSGQNWMRRIDLVFRSSIVIHNTRGYFNIISGVKGGFEGFFNFVWSSIHAIIMEAALFATGMRGNLLTFSDDGLLLFYAKKAATDEEIKVAVLIIQRIYSYAGLVFHMSKTMVSRRLWEYLGDVCLDGKLIPMWVKELASFGKINTSKGLNPVYSRVQIIQGQSDAMVKAGADPITAYMLKRYAFNNLLIEAGVNKDQRLIEALAILPTSLGGLRITSPYEMSIRTTLELDSEFEADMILLKKSNFELYSSLLEYIYCQVSEHKSPVKAIMKSSRFSTVDSKTSGYYVLNLAIDEITSAHGTGDLLVNTPMTSEYERSLNDLLRSINNIDAAMISNLITSTPQWSKYQNSLSLVKSAGAMKLIRRKSIRKLQGMDTRLVQKSSNQIYDFIRTCLSSSITWEKVKRLHESISFKDCDIKPIKPSPRVCLKRVHNVDEAKIIVRNEIERNKSLASAEYVEPRAHVSADFTTAGFKSERTGDIHQRSVRKFVAYAAKVLVSSPESEEVVRFIAELSGIDLPIISPGILRSAHRDIGSSGSNHDISLMLPRYYLARTRSMYSRHEADQLYNLARADRTTYIEASKVISYAIWYSNLIKSRRLIDKVQFFYYNYTEADEVLMHTNNAMTMRRPMPPSSRVLYSDNSLKRDYEISFKEALIQHQTLKRIRDIENPEIPLSENDKMFLTEIGVLSLVKWITSTLSLSKNTIIPNITAPTLETFQWKVLRDSIIISAYESMPYSLRMNVRAFVLRYEDLSDDERAYSIEDFITTPEYQDLHTRIDISSELLQAANIGGLSEAGLAEIKLDLPVIISTLNAKIMASVLLPQGRIVVIRNASYLSGKFSPAHRKAFSEAFDNTICYIYDKGRSLHWNPASIARELGIRGNIDDIIEGLIVASGMIRESQHREVRSPYNKTSYAIELAKYYEFAKAIKTFIEDNPDEDFDDNEIKQLSKEIQLDYEARNNVSEIVKRVMHISELGPDHTRLLEEELSKKCKDRAAYEVIQYYKGRKYSSLSKRDFTYQAADIIQAAVMMYELVIVPTVRSLVEYPKGIDEEILSHFTPSSRTEFDSMELVYTPGEYPLHEVDIVMMPPNDRESYKQLLKEHIRVFVDQNHLVGLRLKNDMDRNLALAASEFENEDGPSIRMNGERGKADIWVCCGTSNSIVKALTSYANLSMKRHSVTTIFKDSNTQLYVVTSIYSNQSGKIAMKDVDEKRLKVSSPMDLEKLVSTVSFTTKARIVSRRARFSEMEEEMGLSTTPGIMIANFLRRINSETELNTDSHILQAAIELAKRDASSTDKFKIYILVLLWLLKQDSTRLAAALAAKVKDKIKASDDQFSIINDIALTYTWCYASHISPSIDIQILRVRDIMDNIPDFTFPYVVPQSVISLSVRKASQVVSNLDANPDRNLVGRLASKLYEVPPRTLEYREEEEEDLDATIVGMDEVEAMLE